jgi:hypothetical protein
MCNIVFNTVVFKLYKIHKDYIELISSSLRNGNAFIKNNKY